LNDHPSGRNHFTGLGTDAGDDARRVRRQRREADDVLRRADAGASRFDLRFGGPASLLGRLEIGPRRDVSLEQMRLSLKRVIR
jgi:hypothetical protein